MSGIMIGLLHVGMMPTNCYVVLKKGSGEAAVIDPGGSAEAIVKALESAAAKPAAILLTHAHFDHILAVGELLERYPECKVYAGADERPMFEDHSLNPIWRDDFNDVAPDIYLKDCEEFEAAGLKFRCFFTPGHTAGSVSYFLAEESALFSGDTLFKDSCGRCDFPTGSEDSMNRSLAKIFAVFKDSVSVLPGHGPSTFIGRERKVWGGE